jgi:predicted ArsR family transcriptional regulator
MADKISSRQHQILKLLLEHRDGLSIDEIATALGISRNAVQQHFASLEKKGYLQNNALTKTAGRPVRTFALTTAGVNYFPKQYAWFSELILTDLKQTMGSAAFEAYLYKLGNSLAQSLSAQFTGKEMTERLEELLRVMNSLGFQAKLAENLAADSLAIEASHCVYHDLAQQHQEVCVFDRALMSALLDKEVEQVECMAKGDHFCCFKIKT